MTDMHTEQTCDPPRSGSRTGFDEVPPFSDGHNPADHPVGQRDSRQHLLVPDGSDAGRLWDVLAGSSGEPCAAVIEHGRFARTGRRSGDRQHALTLLLDKTEMGWTADFKSATRPTTFGRPAPTGNTDTSN